MPRTTGRYEESEVAGERVAAFVPEPLPPRNPPFSIQGDLAALGDRAQTAVARLDLAGRMVPSSDWLIYSLVRKEAVLSSQIEGTQATLVDLLTYEAGAEPAADSDDVAEVCNYLDALEYARDQLRRPDGLPLSLRLLNETHRRLMTGVRGSDRLPGEVRRSQNWVGGTRPGNAVFVPPPHHLLGGLLSDLERYIHDGDDFSPLVRAGLAHVQFETIHPYLDGNGRIGRLLITLLLDEWELVTRPLLYLSLFFRRHQGEYYRRLSAVRTDGDFEGWIAFFLEAVTEVADEAIGLITALFELVTVDRARVLASSETSISSARLFELLPEHPVVTISRIVELLGTTKPTAAKAVRGLVDAGVLVEITGRRRDRVYGYAAYLDLLAALSSL